MSGSISFCLSDDGKNFQELVLDINQALAVYGISGYEPDYDFSRRYQQEQIVLASYDDMPGIDLSMSKKIAIKKLKTIALELEFNSNWIPGDDSLFVGQPIYYDLVEDVFGKKQSHFILHTLYSGYYVPVDFKDTSVPSWFLEGLGSSINL